MNVTQNALRNCDHVIKERPLRSRPMGVVSLFCCLHCGLGTSHIKTWSYIHYKPAAISAEQPTVSDHWKQ